MSRKLAAVAVFVSLAAAGCDMGARQGAAPQQLIGGEGTESGRFENPFGVAVGAEDRVYVTDQHNERVQVLSSTGEFLFQWPVRPGPNGRAYPTGIHVDRGIVWVSANQGNYVARWTTEGGELGPTESPPGGWEYPTGITTDGDGHAYVCDSGRSRIVKLSPEGAYLASWATDRTPYGIDCANDRLYVAHYGAHTIRSFGLDGAPAGGFGGKGEGPGQFSSAEGIAHDSTGALYVCDAGNNRIQKFSPEGRWLSTFGRRGTELGQLRSPSDIDLDSRGDLLVCEYANNRLQRWTPGGAGNRH